MDRKCEICIAKQEQNGSVAREWPIMGYGNVAIGGGRDKEDGMSCLVYLKLDESREINADTTDVFPVGKEAPQDKLLACVYFKDGAAMQQTIEVLQEMQAEIGYTKAQASQEQTKCDNCGELGEFCQQDTVTVTGLHASIGILSNLVDQQWLLLTEVEAVCGRDGHGAPLEDGESDLIDRVRAHIAAITPPTAQEAAHSIKDGT